MLRRFEIRPALPNADPIDVGDCIRGSRIWINLAIVIVGTCPPGKVIAGLLDDEYPTLAATFVSYVRERDPAFGESIKALGFEGAIEKGNALFGLSAKLRLEYGRGIQSFDDGGFSRSLSLRTYTAEVALGPKLQIFPFRKLPLHPYASAHGVIGGTRLQLPAATYSSLSQTETGVNLGYELAGGVTLGQRPKRPNRTSFYLELQKRTAFTRIAGSSRYGLDGWRFLVGLTW